jgi:RNA polymerase sigma-70 factor (ECF subfamily)
MNAVHPADPVAAYASPPLDDEWLELLTTTGPGHDAAVRHLHLLLARAARHQVGSMGIRPSELGGVRVDDIVNQAADEATVAVLARLSRFEGRSRFTTWAYKFGILYAAVEVRRTVWRHREVAFDELPERPSAGGSPEQLAEAAELSRAVRAAIDTALTAHQRRVVVALLMDEVPIDVLADRLGTTRNALYKALHDARSRLRSELRAGGYLDVSGRPEVTS